MKRLALLVITGFLAVILSACGESAEKKAETNATQQTQETTPAPSNAPNETNKPAQ